MYDDCRHIMPAGDRCLSPALKGTPFCYFHTRLHRQAREQKHAGKKPLNLPVPEDRPAIQLAIAQILEALTTNSIDLRRASLMLRALQIATQNVDRRGRVLALGAVKALTRDKNGDEMAIDPNEEEDDEGDDDDDE